MKRQAQRLALLLLAGGWLPGAACGGLVSDDAVDDGTNAADADAMAGDGGPGDASDRTDVASDMGIGGSGSTNLESCEGFPLADTCDIGEVGTQTTPIPCEIPLPDERVYNSNQLAVAVDCILVPFGDPGVDGNHWYLDDRGQQSLIVVQGAVCEQLSGAQGHRVDVFFFCGGGPPY